MSILLITQTEYNRLKKYKGHESKRGTRNKELNEVFSLEEKVVVVTDVVTRLGAERIKKQTLYIKKTTEDM